MFVVCCQHRWKRGALSVATFVVLVERYNAQAFPTDAQLVRDMQPTISASAYCLTRKIMRITLIALFCDMCFACGTSPSPSQRARDTGRRREKTLVDALEIGYAIKEKRAELGLAQAGRQSWQRKPVSPSAVCARSSWGRATACSSTSSRQSSARSV